MTEQAWHGPNRESDGDEDAYEAHREHAAMEALGFTGPEVCGATLVLGPKHDPSSTECEEALGHHPETKHCGLNPYGEGHVTWYGGGMIGGDRLPTREVEFVD